MHWPRWEPSTPTTTSTSACLIASSGDHRLAVAAEIDCVDDSGAYVELKTNKLLASKRLVGTFERFKMFKFWVQSHTRRHARQVIVGFRDEDELRKVRAFDTLALPGLAAAWRPRACLGFADAVLTWLRAALDAADGDAYVVTGARSRNARDFVRSRRWREAATACLMLFLCSPSSREMGAAAADESHTAGPGRNGPPRRLRERPARPARAPTSHSNRPICACFPTMKRLSKKCEAGCWARGAGLGRRGGCPGRRARGDSCLCNRLRLPPRARARKGAPGPVGHLCAPLHQPSPAARHRLR